MKNIFEFYDYKQFIVALEADRSPLLKGFRTKLAQSLTCQSAFITQVLNGGAHLSAEQALKCSVFLGLNENEKKYFLLLNQYNRAGTEDLKQFLRAEIDQMKERYFDLENRITVQSVLSDAVKNKFYSHWIYPTVHMLITIPEYQTLESIQKALKISKNKTKEVLLFLVSHDLAKESHGKYITGRAQLHLSKNADLVKHHHQNMRLRAIESLQSENYNEDLHYTAISSLSHKDFERLKALLLKTIEDYINVIGPSREEALCGLNIDFYKMLEG